MPLEDWWALLLTLEGREYHIWNKTTYSGNAQKTKENYVKLILPSLAYITLIRLSFCISTGERES